MAVEHDYRPAYKSVLVVGGLLFVALGAGNWVIGAVRAAPHKENVARTHESRAARHDLKDYLLEPHDENVEERDISRAKLEYYELVRTGGRLMVVVGSLFLIAGIGGLGRARRLNFPFDEGTERETPV